MGTEIIEYKGYTLMVQSQGMGWRVPIYPPRSSFSLQQIPYTRSFDKRDDVIAQAKAIVDKHVQEQ